MTKLSYILIILLTTLGAHAQVVRTIGGKVLTYQGKVMTISWTPSDIEGLEIWYTAEETNTRIDGSTTYITQLDDKSGNNNATQSTAAKQAIYQDTAFGGRGGLLFDGDNDNSLLDSYIEPDTNRIAVFVYIRQNVIEDGFILRDGRNGATGYPSGTGIYANVMYRINHTTAALYAGSACTNEYNTCTTVESSSFTAVGSVTTLSNQSLKMMVGYINYGDADEVLFYQNDAQLGTTQTLDRYMSITSVGHNVISFNGWIRHVVIIDLSDRGDLTADEITNLYNWMEDN